MTEATERDARDARGEPHGDGTEVERQETEGLDAESVAGERPDNPHSEDVEALRRQAEENWSKYLRAVAELDNYRKRSARELEVARRYAAERLGQEVLPVRDSIEAALASADNVDVATLLEGERATLKLLDQALENVGITEIDPSGQPFDPTKHEAMAVQPTADQPPDTVLLVVQKGYQLHDRLLRPARVIVASLPARGDA